MIATIVMTWDWQELPIDIGTELSKLEWRYTESDKITNSFWALFDSLCITADMDNQWPVLVSDYAEDKQVNDGNIADFIELQPSGELHLPRNRQLQALNRPFVMWEAWDVIKVVAR